MANTFKITKQYWDEMTIREKVYVGVSLYITGDNPLEGVKRLMPFHEEAGIRGLPLVKFDEDFKPIGIIENQAGKVVLVEIGQWYLEMRAKYVRSYKILKELEAYGQVVKGKA